MIQVTNFTESDYELEFHGNLKTMVGDTLAIINGLYTMVKEDDEDMATAYRNLLCYFLKKHRDSIFCDEKKHIKWPSPEEVAANDIDD